MLQLPEKREPFKVIIVGGSVTGLTLAHALNHIPGVDYVVLERRDEIAPQEGASIGLVPNGLRILDQLGIWERLQPFTKPWGVSKMYFPDGTNFELNYPKKVHDL